MALSRPAQPFLLSQKKKKKRCCRHIYSLAIKFDTALEPLRASLGSHDRRKHKLSFCFAGWGGRHHNLVLNLQVNEAAALSRYTAGSSSQGPDEVGAPLRLKAAAPPPPSWVGSRPNGERLGGGKVATQRQADQAFPNNLPRVLSPITGEKESERERERVCCCGSGLGCLMFWEATDSLMLNF